ncbi:MAG: hypothetical protein ACRDA8_10530, partial [Shewanella sp.]
LNKQGFIKHLSGTGKPNNAKRYGINQKLQPAPSHKGGSRKARVGRTGQQLVWNTLRINRRVTVNTVVAVTGCKDKSIYNYLLQLERAGYLHAVRVDTRLPSTERVGKEAQWLLRVAGPDTLGDTGPKAPILRRGSGMFDQNRQQFYPFCQSPRRAKATPDSHRVQESPLCNG